MKQRAVHLIYGRHGGCLRAVLLLSAFAAMACTPKIEPEPEPAATASLRTTAGVLRGGVSTENIASFRNIPYAAPPIGPLRWRAPQPALQWSTEREARRFGNDCLQNREAWDRASSAQPLSEDCLYLNVWTAWPLAPSAPRPVMVWIHGGGLASGTGNSPLSYGQQLAERGVVLVTFNYRLGRFGFFAHPALRDTSLAEPIGNYGLMDQLAVLKWVKANISAFGGDPGNVTVFGESAGGLSVLQLMLTPSARGLFHKAIVQSGGGRLPMARLREDLPSNPSAETRGRKFAESVGLRDATATALRALPAETVLGKISLIEWDKAQWTGLAVNGIDVQSEAVAGFVAGRQMRIPLLIGANGAEFSGLPGFILSRINRDLEPLLGAGVESVRRAYSDEDAFERNLSSDFGFVEPARTIAAAASAVQPTYLYRFNYVAESRRKDSRGAGHASDVAYIFGRLQATGHEIVEADRAFSRLLSDYWTTFAKTGVPAVPGRSAWQPYSKSNDQLYEFGLHGETTMKPAAAPWIDAITRVMASGDSH